MVIKRKTRAPRRNTTKFSTLLASCESDLVVMGNADGEHPIARASLSLYRPSINAHKVEEQQLKRAQLEKLHSESLASKKAILVVKADGEPEV